MTSNDVVVYVTRDEFIFRMDAQDAGLSEIRGTLSEIRQDVKSLASELRHTNDRLDWLQHTVYWGFAIIGIVIALVELPRRDKPEPRENISASTEKFTVKDMLALMKFARGDKNSE